MSVNTVDQSTGNTTPLAGNTNNLVGNLSALTTSVKSDAVGAINELNQTKQNKTDNNLQTTDKTVVGAVNELKSGLTNLSSNIAVSYYGAVPNGKFGDNMAVTIPYWNPTNRQPVLNEAYIYDSDGNFTNILSGMSISKYTKTYLLVSFSYNANYVGKMIRVEVL